MEELKIEIGDFVIIKSFPLGDKCDVVGKVITIRKKIITDIDIVIRAKYPRIFYNDSFPIKWSNDFWNRIVVLGKDPIITAIYE